MPPRRAPAPRAACPRRRAARARAWPPRRARARARRAPRPDELVVVAAASSGPRPNARIGDRRTDPAVRLADLEKAL
ncbi:hypothetical protein [Streptomyces sp. ST1020]|uniref:hypothetical protein n=1 Tax=Streptomyces sp. ST1020 TaxID=1848901 RepID=UPI0034C6CEDE